MSQLEVDNEGLGSFSIYDKNHKTTKFLNSKNKLLILIWAGCLEVHFAVGGWGKITLCLKPVRIML